MTIGQTVKRTLMGTYNFRRDDFQVTTEKGSAVVRRAYSTTRLALVARCLVASGYQVTDNGDHLEVTT